MTNQATTIYTQNEHKERGIEEAMTSTIRSSKEIAPFSLHSTAPFSIDSLRKVNANTNRQDANRKRKRWRRGASIPLPLAC